MSSPPFTIYACYHCPNRRTIATIGPPLSSSRSTATLLHLIEKIDVATIVDAIDRQLFCFSTTTTTLYLLKSHITTISTIRTQCVVAHHRLPPPYYFRQVESLSKPIGTQNQHQHILLNERFTVCKQQSESLGSARNESAVKNFLRYGAMTEVCPVDIIGQTNKSFKFNFDMNMLDFEHQYTSLLMHVIRPAAENMEVVAVVQKYGEGN
ncbi:hypothetical protein L2E82_24779 [Cichorium intybus]|uniref:Uncharacterized protein n=1 Tax=Cichorium intybus TaxID=13427 RepID=A0ACB9E2P0_CICIN|nr:hypothetical protein L2E82_24779 [Cichorium intybus]